MDNLEYAEMLEIPVNTVNVVKKKSLFRRKGQEKEDLKEDVLESVNSRLEDEQEYSPRADFIQTENLNEPQIKVTKKRDGVNTILIAEAVAACLLAGGIFVTNTLVDNTAINNLVSGFYQTASEEAEYYDFTLSPVVSALSDAEVTVTDGGVLCFTDQTAVYPVCEGKIASVTSADGLYTVTIEHTSSFSSVFTGLSEVYCSAGDEVRANIPFAYSDGQSEVRVSMYDGQTLLSGYTLSDAVPVWNS